MTGGEAQLATVGDILGIEDHDMLAPGQRHGKIQCLGLGVGPSIGDEHQLEPRVTHRGAHGGDRLRALRLHHELDVELLRRVVAALCIKRTKVY